MEEIGKTLQEISTSQQILTAVIILALIIRFLLWGLEVMEENQKTKQQKLKKYKEEIKKEIIEYYEQTKK